MKTDVVHNLCEDLDKLLKDICEFLSDEINNTNLTEKQRLFANRLIERSKKQLQQISTVLSIPESDDAYVDMSPQAVPENDGIYEDTNLMSPVTEGLSCPYNDLPAIKMEECEKFGFLERKGKIFFIDHHRKLYAGIKNNWLLIYSCKKDIKPIDCLNLSLYTAKSMDSPKGRTFQLTCIKTLKVFLFVAQTPKDMMQWLACINKCTSYKEVVDYNSVSLNEGKGPYEAVINELDIKADTRKRTMTKPLPPLPPSGTETNSYLPPKRSHDANQIINEIEEDPMYSELEDCRIQITKNVQNSNKRLPSKQCEIKRDSQNSSSEDAEYDLPEPVAPKYFRNQHQGKIKDTKDYYNTDSTQKHPRIDQIPTESQMTDSFSELEDDNYDVIEKRPILKQQTKSLNNHGTIISKQNSQITERGSQLTIDSFSEIEDETYDIPERPSPMSQLLARQLQKNVSFQISSMKVDLEEADGEYCNLIKRENDIVKDVVNKGNEDEDIEYDYLCSEPDPISNKKSTKSFNILKQKIEKLAPPVNPKPATLKKIRN